MIVYVGRIGVGSMFELSRAQALIELQAGAARAGCTLLRPEYFARGLRVWVLGHRFTVSARWVP